MTGQGRQAAPPELALPSSGAQAANEEVARYYSDHRDTLRDFLVYGCQCPWADAEDIIQDTIETIRRRYWPTIRTYDKPGPTGSRSPNGGTTGSVAGRLDGSPRATRQSGCSAWPIRGDQFAAVDRRQALEAVIRELPRRQRQVLWLRLVADFSEAETAAILDISVGSVKTNLHHARKRTQELLRKDSATWEAEVQ